MSFLKLNNKKNKPAEKQDKKLLDSSVKEESEKLKTQTSKN